MGLFRRRRREDDDEEEKDIDDLPKKPSRKKFKDLDGENAPKRKAPPKPWGKKERFLVFVFFVGMTLTAAILAGSSRNWKIAGIPRLKISNPIPDTLVIEKPTPQPRIVRDYEPLKREIQNMVFNLSGVYGIYVWDLKGGSGFGINENETMKAASLIKLPIMADIYKLAEDKKLSLSQTYSLKNEDRVSGAGSLVGQPEGTSITNRELVEYMGHQSDNTAFSIALNKIIGKEKAQEYIESLGMVKTDINENQTTPYEIGMFFKNLWSGNIIKDTSKDEILKSLTNTIWEEWLPKYINDDNVDIAHKYGSLPHVINDAGIVFIDKPYIIVIMTDGIVESQANEALPKIIKMIHEFMSEDK